MKKGLGASIILIVLGHITIFAFLAFIEPFVLSTFRKPTSEYIGISLALILTFSSFIVFAYHLKRKYREEITQIRFLSLGAFGSLISSLSIVLSLPLFFYIRFGRFQSDIIAQNIKETPIIIIILSFECLIVSFFLKKINPKSKSNNNSLDSDILNED